MYEREWNTEANCPDLDSPEGVAEWNTLARRCVEDGLAYFVNETGERCDAPVLDADGRILFRTIEFEVETKPAPHARTLGDVMALDPDDAFDAAMASLPIYANLLERARAALLANIDGPTIQARLRCSGPLVSRARRELREELREDDWPMSLSNARSHSRRANPDRPNMTREAGGNPFQLRALSLGCDEAHARAVANGKLQERKFRERPEDLGDAARKRRKGD